MQHGKYRRRRQGEIVAPLPLVCEQRKTRTKRKRNDHPDIDERAVIKNPGDDITNKKQRRRYKKRRIEFDFAPLLHETYKRCHCDHLKYGCGNIERRRLGRFAHHVVRRGHAEPNKVGKHDRRKQNQPYPIEPER